MTERSHVDVHDIRHTPALIGAFDVAGVESLDAQYTYRSGNSFGVFELYSGSSSQTLRLGSGTPSDKALVRLNVDASSGVSVKAHWHPLYEVESGSRLSTGAGDIIQFARSGFHGRSAPLLDSSDAPIRIVIRPIMSSPLWRWQKRTAMRGYNGRYYLSAFHDAGVSNTELTTAIKQNPPAD